MVDGERFAGANRDAAGMRVLVYDVQRRSVCYSDAAALADREAVEAFVLSEDAAVEGDNFSALRFGLPQASQEFCLVDAGQEAEVLAFGLVCHCQVGFPCSASYVRLQRLTQREPQLVEVV